ncbi:hypothetical protein, partial [Burkholderia multivorans]|uniref:hypothetical protein n=2 Tax=Burkholderia multivorans TaxID=87883 RepID=UPI002870013F
PCQSGVWTGLGNSQPRAYGNATSDVTVGPYNWCYLQGYDNPQNNAFGLWEVAIVSDGGPNNRYFFLHNSKGGGAGIQYSCF